LIGTRSIAPTRPESPSAAREELRVRIVIALVAAMALLARTVALGDHNLWFDEALEFGRAAADLRTVVIGRPVDQDPPLFALFHHFWLRLGDSEAWLRMPSALLGAGTVALAGHWAAVRLGNRAGLVTAVLLALAPVHVHYSREMNQYAAVVFLSVAALMTWERLIVRNRAVDWCRYGLVSALALGLHYGMAFPLLAMGLFLAVRIHRCGSSADRRRLAAYALACAVVVAVLLGTGLVERLAVPHLQRRFGGTGVAKELRYVADIGWREILVFFLLPFSGGPALRAVVALSAAATAGAALLWRRGGAGQRIVGIGFFGALAAVYPADGMGLYPMGHRYVLWASLPFLAALGAAFGLLLDRVRPAGIAALVATGGLFAFFWTHEPWPNPWVAAPREELQPILAAIERHGPPTDAVYVHYAAEPAAKYYGAGQTEQEGQMGRVVLWGRHYVPATAEAEARRISTAAVGRGVWLVFAHADAGDRDALLAALEACGRSPTIRVRAPGTEAILLARPSAGPAQGAADGPLRSSSARPPPNSPPPEPPGTLAR
jgi:hypothetical protein